MKNQAVVWTVKGALSRDVHWAVHRKVSYAVSRDTFVVEAVVADVYRALDETGAPRGAPPPPELALYLGGVG